MMQGAIQSPEVREKVSSTETNLSKNPCLGQQLPHFCSPNHQMVQSGHLGFSFGGNHLPPSFCFPPPPHPFAHFPPGNGLPNNLQVFPFAAAQNVSLEVDAAQDANGRSVLKPSPPGSSSVAGSFMSPLISAVILLQQKVSQLHSLIQLIAEGGQGNHSFGQQQATVAAAVATFISQLALTTAGMLQCSQQQQQQQQQQHQHQHQHQPLGLCSAPNWPDAHINHIFGMPAPFGVDLFHANRYKGHNLGESVCNLLGGALASSGTPTEDNSHLVEKPFNRVTTACLGYQHIVARENAQCNTEICRNTVASNTDGVVTAAFREVGCVHAASKTNMNCEDLDSAGGSRDEEDDGEAEHLLPGSYDIVEMDAVEILAEHTHFCDICSKGFKRDANLRMHMRGHGDEYKTPAALARPDRSQDLPVVKLRRFSCPFAGCKRNKNHRKFLPLKTMLCVKNHYRRSHCPKLLTCSKCQSKKFSVVADLKTHEKHCGCDKWQCSCGTTFSRKDKLLGHIGLFQGHMPAFPFHEMEGSSRGGGTDVAVHEEDCGGGRRTADRHEVTLTREVKDGTEFSVGCLNDSVLRVGGGLNNQGDLTPETNLRSDPDVSLDMVDVAPIEGILRRLESKGTSTPFCQVSKINGSLSGSGVSCRDFSQSTGKDVAGLHGLIGVDFVQDGRR